MSLPIKLVRQRSRGPVLTTPPPLPLIALSPDDEWEEFETPTQTGFGYTLPFLSALDDPEAHKQAEVGSVDVAPDAPMRAQLLSEYMTNNEYFQSPRHGFGHEIRLIYKRNKELESGPNSLLPNAGNPEEIRFCGTFESGNLDRAYRVLGRRYAPSNELLVLRSSPSFKGSARLSSTEPIVPTSKVQALNIPALLFADVDAEYDLVAVPALLLRRARERGVSAHKVRFNIRNMLKKTSLYNEGMLPVLYVEDPTVPQRGWHRAGTNVCYFKNTDTYRHRRTGKVRNFYSLSFVYEFATRDSPLPLKSSNSNVDDKPVVAYFAHCYPYTYTRLQKFLLSMQKDPERKRTFKRRVLSKTIAGNNCDLLTITDFSQEDENDATDFTRRRAAIVITARVHPGESNSSFVMHGILEFLTGSSLEARFLRHHFVFKIVPMLNPDGVIHGNYRCSLAGTDLNRRWLNPSSELHPTIFATKNMIKLVCKVRPVRLYCDLHGHSRKKNIFLYGCRPYNPASRSEAARVRLFPHILCKTSDCIHGGFYSFGDCTFSVNTSKRGTGRIVIWEQMRVLHSFTLEASFFGVDNSVKYQRQHVQTMRFDLDPRESTLRHFTPADFHISGVKLCHALIPFSQAVTFQRANTASTALAAPTQAETQKINNESNHAVMALPQRLESSNNSSTSVKCFDLMSSSAGDSEFLSHSKIYLEPLQKPQSPSVLVNEQDRLASWVAPHRPEPCLQDPVLTDTEDCGTFFAHLPSEFDQLFAGEEISLLDHENLIQEIEASLPDNFQDSPEEDGSAGSESEPFEGTEDEAEVETTSKIPPQEIANQQIVEFESTKLIVPALMRNRPPRISRHLSEPQLLQEIMPKRFPEREIIPSAEVATRSRANATMSSKPSIPLAPLKRERIQVYQSAPHDRNREIAAMHLHAVQRRSKSRRNLRQINVEIDGV